MPETWMARHCIGLNHVAIGIENVGDGANSQQNQFWVPRLNQIFSDNSAAAKNLRDGNAFLAANKTKPGVITTASGLQYKILSNPTPNAQIARWGLFQIESQYLGTPWVVDGNSPLKGVA